MKTPRSILGWLRIAVPLVAIAVCLVIPQVVEDVHLDKMTIWMTYAVAVMGLNLLTGYNGQISVGHGAFFGLGAYACGLFFMKAELDTGSSMTLAVLVCFIVGVILGLPALRLKGMYLALVTLAVAVLFPDLVKHFESFTGGLSGLYMRTEELNSRGVMVKKPIRMLAPEGLDLTQAQWTFYLFLAITIVVFIVARNIVTSRIGRAMVAVRDNETAAEVNGVNVSAVKVFTFGLSAALAGLGGAMFAIFKSQLSPLSFTLALSLTLMVSMVIGGPASIMGPAIGAVVSGVFDDFIKTELPKNWQPLTPIILGVSLISLMLVAPGGIAGSARQLAGRLFGSIKGSPGRSSGEASPSQMDSPAATT